MDSPLKGRGEHSNLITVDSSRKDSKQSSNCLGAEDAKTGLGSISSIEHLEGSHVKLTKSFSSIEE